MVTCNKLVMILEPTEVHTESGGYVNFDPEKKKEGGTTSEQHEWLRKYCFDNRISQAEVLRQALELYRQELAKKERKG